MSKHITLSKNNPERNFYLCMICEEKKEGGDVYEPCANCREQYLQHGVLLVEVVGKGEHEKPTGRLMIIRDIAFEHVFNQTVPKQHVTKVEVGILQKMEEHIASAE